MRETERKRKIFEHGLMRDERDTERKREIFGLENKFSKRFTL